MFTKINGLIGLLFIAITVIFCSGCQNLGLTQKKYIRILCLASYDTKNQGLDYIDKKALNAYKKKGFILDFDYYQKVDYKKISEYSVVVGMIPELHAGTKAIDKKLGKEIKKYIKNGGGFLLIPGPSYYGVEDFTIQLNPWLQQFGAELLNEIPRDLVNQKELIRVLAYRYLKTANFADHKVMDGIDNIYLPLDFSNNFIRTHTMKVDKTKGWEVLINGEKSCSTHPFKEYRSGNPAPGVYNSEPPFLAVRNLGKGKLAIFTTASRYMIFDAYHWAHGSGFVMEKGNCLKLMSNLFDYLAGNSKFLATKTVPKIKNSKTLVKGNVPIKIHTKEWLKCVLKEFKPENSSVKYYIDCGALSDIPYNNYRGYGYVDTPHTNWLIRWPWSEIFHATASNSRGFDIKTLQYKFDDLTLGKKYQLGVMVWGYQDPGSEAIKIKAGENILIKNLKLPKFSKKQGPLFKLLKIPESSIKENSLTLSFSKVDNKKGTFSSVCELWLFEEGVKTPSITPEEIISNFESPSDYRKESVFDLTYRSGVIGAHSNYTDGKASVAEMCKAAKNAGLDFLVFTDDVTKLDKQKLNKLKNDCKKASDDKFLALPGFTFSAKYVNRKYNPCEPQTWGAIESYLFQNVQTLPPKKAYDVPYSLYWKFFGGEFCGGKNSPPTLLSPGKNAIPPFFQRFWRGFNVLTFDENAKIEDDSKELYIDLLSSGYGPYPRVSGTFRTPAEVAKFAKKWRTVIPAKKINEIPLFHYSSFITNGPEITRYAFSFDHMREGENGGGLLYRDKCWLMLDFKVKSPTDIKEITLYSDKTPIRKWYPNSTFFTKKESIQISRQHRLWLHVEADEGKEAFSGRFFTQDHKFMVGMCADNQNSICSLTQKPLKYERDERELYLQHSYWHTGEAAGQLGILVNGRDLVPRIIETGIIQLVKHFLPTPKIWFKDGVVEDHTTGEMRILAGAKDFNIIEYRFDPPKTRTSSIVKLTSFRPAVGGGTAILIETDFLAKTDIKLKSLSSLRNLSLALNPPLPPIWNYSYSSPENGILTGKFADIKGKDVVSTSVSSDGGVMLWPNDVGNILIFPLGKSGSEFNLKFDNLKGVWNGREHVELYSPVRELKKGTHIKTKILVILHSGKVTSETDLVELRKSYVDIENYISKITKGTVSSPGYVLNIQAKNGSSAGVIDLSEKLDPLPVVIQGVNPNWSCARIQDNNITILNSENDSLKTIIDSKKKNQQFFIGNILQADNRNIILEFAQVHAGGVRLHIHNPKSESKTFRIFTNPDVPQIPQVDCQVTLAPGESIWGWAKDNLIVFENSGLQVDRCKKVKDAYSLEVHGTGPVLFSGKIKAVSLNGKSVKIQEDEGIKIIDNGDVKIKNIIFQK